MTSQWGWVQPSLESSLPNTEFPKRTEKPYAGSVKSVFRGVPNGWKEELNFHLDEFGAHQCVVSRMVPSDGGCRSVAVGNAVCGH